MMRLVAIISHISSYTYVNDVPGINPHHDIFAHKLGFPIPFPLRVINDRRINKEGDMTMKYVPTTVEPEQGNADFDVKLSKKRVIVEYNFPAMFGFPRIYNFERPLVTPNFHRIQYSLP